MAGEPPHHWRSRLEARAIGPAIGSGTVAIATVDGFVAALDPDTGKARWRADIDGLPATSPAVDDEVFAVATEDGSLFGFDVRTGDRRFRFKTEGRIEASPSLQDDVICVVDTEGTVFGVDPATGTEGWRLEKSTPMVQTVTATGSVIALALQDGTIEGFDPETVNRQWRIREDSSITAGPKLTESAIVYGAEGGIFSFCELESVTKRRGGTKLTFDRSVRDIGSQGTNVVIVSKDEVFRTVYDESSLSRWDRWSLNVDRLPLSRWIDDEVTLVTVAVTDRLVFVGCSDGSVLALDTETGDPMWRFEAAESTDVPRVVTGEERVVIGGSDSAVYSFRTDVDQDGTIDPTIEWDVDTAAHTPESEGTVPAAPTGETSSKRSGTGPSTPSSRDDGTDSNSAADSSDNVDRSDEHRERIEELRARLDERETEIERLKHELLRVRDRDPLADDLSDLANIYDRLVSLSFPTDDPRAVAVGHSVRDLWSLLEAHDVERIDPDTGIPVDPNAHEVIDTEASPMPADHVVAVDSLGFRRDGTVLTRANVIASNGAEAPTANDAFEGKPVVTTGPAYVYEGQLHRSGGDRVRVVTPAPSLCKHDIEAAFLEAVEKWRTISSHPRTVEVVEYGETPHAWAAIDWKRYEPLPERIGGLSQEDRLSIVEDIADAIRNADKYNIRHRRLRPSSVWLSQETGGPLEAAVAGWEVIAVLENASNGTNLDPYSAPEQLTDDPIGGHTDIYRLGALTYRLFTGVPPYERDGSLRSSILDGSFPQPSTIDDDLNSSVDEVISRAMAQIPQNRYNSSYNFQIELADAI